MCCDKLLPPNKYREMRMEGPKVGGSAMLCYKCQTGGWQGGLSWAALTLHIPYQAESS